MKINHGYLQHVAEAAEAELDRAVVHLRRAHALLDELGESPNEVSFDYLDEAGVYRAARDLAIEADAVELLLARVERDRIVIPAEVAA